MHYKSPRKINEEGQYLADRLRAVRYALGLTQVEMAGCFRVSASSYVRWELFGPPNTSVHRQFVRIKLAQIQKGPLPGRRRTERRRQARLAAARAAMLA